MTLLSAVLYEIFPEAANIMLPYFKNRNLPVNRTLASDMMRYEVKMSLGQFGIYVALEGENDDAHDPVMSPLALNGLEGTYGGYAFKILKSDTGELPIPGYSGRKQRYYGQQLRLVPDEGQSEKIHPNVIYLWDCDHEWQQFSLRLVAPKHGGITRASVDHYWNVPVAIPATKARADFASQEAQTEPRIKRKATVPRPGQRNSSPRTSFGT